MRLANRTDYAIRASLVLAGNFTKGPVTVEAIARTQEIPQRYLGAIMNELRRAGIVNARRGPVGGYELGRAPAEISLADVIRAVDGALTQVGGERPEDLNYVNEAVGLNQVWVAIRAAERKILEQTTLADVVGNRLPDSVAALIVDPAAWQ